MTAIVMLVTFVVILAIGAPIGTAMGLSTIVALLSEGMNLSMIPYNYYASISRFLLLAIPFFILGGNIMEMAGISRKLIHFARSLVGHLRGGLALVCVIVACFFAAISGSGPATVAALGMIIIPAMQEVGYSKGSAAALMATSGGIGIIIPPSISLIIYSAISGVSTSRLFMAGVIPGLLMGLGLFIASLIETRKINFDKIPKASKTERWVAFKDAFWGLMMPVIILGGIYGGVFTPTEAAAVSAVYGLLVGVFIYKTVKIHELYKIFVVSARQTGAIMYTVGTAALMSWVLTVSGLATSLANGITVISGGNVIIFMLIVNIILIAAGCFIDGNSIMYIFVPVFLPVAMQLGYDPLVLGVVMVMNIAVGMVTPPVGINLYVACGLVNMDVRDIIKPVMPYVISSVVSLLLVTYVPPITQFLPNLLS